MPSVSCPVCRSHSCCRSVSSLCSTCCHPGVEGLELRLRSLLRGSCFGTMVPWGPRFLLPVRWWRCWFGVARSCSPGQFPASVLVPGLWSGLPRLSPSIRLPPLGWLDWWIWVCLHILKWSLYSFMERLPLISRESLAPSSVAVDSFSSSSSLHLHARAQPEE